MSRDKQIEEMAKVIRESDINFVKERVRSIENDLIEPPPSRSEYIAIALMESDYRKASEVAEEIFGEIDKIIDKHYNRHIFGVEDLSDVEQEAVMNFSGDVTYDIAELKKKYTEDK